MAPSSIMNILHENSKEIEGNTGIGGDETVIDRDMILKFRLEEISLNKITNPDQRLGVRKAANYLLFKALNMLKAGESREKVLSTYDDAISILSGGGLILEDSEEWKKIDEIIRSLRAEENTYELMEMNFSDIKKMLIVSSNNIKTMLDLAKEDRKEIKNAANLLLSLTGDKKAVSSTAKLFFVTLTSISFVLLMIVISSVFISRAILQAG